MILLRIGIIAQEAGNISTTGDNTGWFFFSSEASGHLITCGLI